jgi:prepilin-type N-terminal cleavage/methylation domain-containing protein
MTPNPLDTDRKMKYTHSMNTKRAIENRPPAWQPRSGFTLVELLVVMAILGVLVSLLLPGLTNATESARSTACRSKISKIYGGTALYANDHRGELHTVMNVQGGTFGNWGANYPGPFANHSHHYNGWPRVLEEYLGPRPDYIFCPSDSPRARAAMNMAPHVHDDPTLVHSEQALNLAHRSSGSIGGAYVSYKFRHAVDAYTVLWTRIPTFADFGFPSRQVLWHEIGDFHGEQIGFFGQSQFEAGLRFVNVAFVDGQVRRYSGFSVPVAGKIAEPNFFRALTGWLYAGSDIARNYDHPDQH